MRFFFWRPSQLFLIRCVVLGQGCTDCKALRDKFVICENGLSKWTEFNWIELVIGHDTLKYMFSLWLSLRFTTGRFNCQVCGLKIKSSSHWVWDPVSQTTCRGGLVLSSGLSVVRTTCTKRSSPSFSSDTGVPLPWRAKRNPRAGAQLSPVELLLKNNRSFKLKA